MKKYIGGGSFGEVYRGSLSGIAVVVNRARIYSSRSDDERSQATKVCPETLSMIDSQIEDHVSEGIVSRGRFLDPPRSPNYLAILRRRSDLI